MTDDPVVDRRGFVRAMTGQAVRGLGVVAAASGTLTRASGAVLSQLRSELVPDPAPDDPMDAASSVTSQPIFRALDGGGFEILDRTSTPAEPRYLSVADGTGFARALREGAIGLGPILGPLAVHALAGTARSIPGLDASGRSNALRATEELIRRSRPASGSLAHALAQASFVRERAREGAPEAPAGDLLALADSLSRELASSNVALAKRLDRETTGEGGLLLHGPWSRHATGDPSIASALWSSAGAIRPLYVTEGRPYDEGRLMEAWAPGTPPTRTAQTAPYLVVPDSYGPGLIGSGAVRAVVVLAERVDAGGSALAAIGSLALAMMAADHRVLFVVAAALGARTTATVPLDDEPHSDPRLAMRRDRPIPLPRINELGALDAIPGTLISRVVSHDGV